MIGADRPGARPDGGNRLTIETDRLTSRPEQDARLTIGLDHDLPPRKRVLAGVTVLVAVLGASFVLLAFLVVALRQDQTQLHTRNVPYASAISEARLWAKAMANDERGFLITGDRTFIRQIDQRLGRVRQAFVDAKQAADGDAQVRALDEAIAGFERWYQRLRSQLDLYDAGRTEVATQQALGAGRDLRKEYEASLGRAQALADRAVASATRSVDSASERFIALLLALLVVTLGTGFAVAAWLMHSIVRPAYTLLGLFGDGTRTQPR